tara:strand:+ start:144436 stop:144798 length:363 start_codon:yes stop_codon:yes gene_type:complete
MLQMESVLDVADNTGAKKFKMIRRLGQLKRTAGIGDVVIGSVTEATPKSSIPKKTVIRGVIVRTKYPTHRADGSSLRFDQNAVVLVDEKNSPKGTRVFGPVARELRKNFMKIISQAPEVL